MIFSDIKALLFDYGGTLDTNGRHWSNVLFEGFNHAQVPVSEDQFREAYVFAERELAKTPIIHPNDDFLTLLRKKINIETQQLVKLEYWKTNETYRKNRTEVIAHYCDNIVRDNLQITRPILQKLKEKYKLILVTNFYGNISAVLRAYELNFFDTIIESAVVGVRKPDPVIWQLGVDKAKCPANQTVAIGDAFKKDILPANQIGCNTIWLKGETWQPENNDESIPNAIITSFKDIEKYL